MTRQVIERGRLGVLTKVGQGGQGVVYGAPNVTTKFAASMVFKEYKIQTWADVDFTALAAMPALVEDSLSYAEAERLVSVAAWPCALVEDNGRSTGFVMPAIPREFFIPLTTVKGVSTVAGEFQHLLNDASVVAARGIDIDDAQRYALLREVASGLAFLHKHWVCVGDISPKNVLFSLSPYEAVYFIDCDAMRIKGISALRQVETPGWEVPAGEELATIYSDTYKLGLLALRLLAGDHDVKNPHRLPSTTPDLLRQIITDALTKQPHARPLPEAWSYVLSDAIEHAQHHHKTAAATLARAVPEIAGVPVVHSTRSAPPPDSRSTLPQPIPCGRPVERPPAELIEETPQRNRQSNGVGLAILIVVVAVILAGGGILGYSLLRRSHASQTATESSSPSVSTVRSAPSSEITALPAPAAQPIPEPSLHYLKTPWGTRCQVSTNQIICDTCEPGLVLDTPAGANCPGPSLNEIGVESSGAKQTPSAGVILPASPSVQQLSDGLTYEVNGWTITVGGWVRFTNNATGHGMAVAAQNEEFF